MDFLHMYNFLPSSEFLFFFFFALAVAILIDFWIYRSASFLLHDLAGISEKTSKRLKP